MLNTKDILKLIKSKHPIPKLSKTNLRAIKSVKEVLIIMKEKYHCTPLQIQRFINRMPNHLRKSNHDFYNLLKLQGISIQGNGKLTKLKRPKWLSSGMEINGQCITTKVAESPQTAKESILSNILLENVPQQYFINRKKLRKILNQ